MVRAGIPERVAMMVSGADLQLAAQRMEVYLRAQIGTILGTVHEL
jgi:hypothetical protein